MTNASSQFPAPVGSPVESPPDSPRNQAPITHVCELFRRTDIIRYLMVEDAVRNPSWLFALNIAAAPARTVLAVLAALHQVAGSADPDVIFTALQRAYTAAQRCDIADPCEEKALREILVPGLLD